MNKQDQKISNLYTLNALTSLLTIGVIIYATSLYVTTLTQKAEIAYLQAFTKHIETKGLEHWNNWYQLDQNKFSQPKNVDEIIEFVFGKNANQAKKIAKCESGYNHKAKNKQSSARGLFQVLAYTHEIDDKWLYNPMINTLVARELFNASGWTPWEASRLCWQK